MTDLLVESHLPQRPPFLFVERVAEHRPGESLTAACPVAVDDPVFGGHFPGAPVLPGVLLAERMAQVASLLLALDGGPRFAGRLVVLSAIQKLNFLKPVGPGADLRVTATVERVLGDSAVVKVAARVGDVAVAKGELVLTAVAGLQETT